MKNVHVLGDVRWCTACNSANMELVGYDVVTSYFPTLPLF